MFLSLIPAAIVIAIVVLFILRLGKPKVLPQGPAAAGSASGETEINSNAEAPSATRQRFPAATPEVPEGQLPGTGEQRFDQSPDSVRAVVADPEDGPGDAEVPLVSDDIPV